MKWKCWACGKKMAPSLSRGRFLTLCFRDGEMSLTSPICDECVCLIIKLIRKRQAMQEAGVK